MELNFSVDVNRTQQQPLVAPRADEHDGDSSSCVFKALDLTLREQVTVGMLKFHTDKMSFSS